MPILGVGGVSRIISDIIPLLNNKEGVKADLLVCNVKQTSFFSVLDNAGINIFIMNRFAYNPLCIFKIANYIKKYDLIHVHLFPSLYFVAFASFFSMKPLVYTEHNTYNKRRSKRYLRCIEKCVYRRYQKIISISEQTEKNLKDWLGVNNNDKRFVVVNNGIKIDSFMPYEKQHICHHTLIMVSRFAPAKDQMTIIKAMKILKEDIQLILVGDGDSIGYCKTLACELQVTDRVHFVGLQTDIPSWLAKADIGIQSSIWEGFGLTAVEMMAAGLPVIASDVEGLNQIVDGAGLLFPCGDTEKLAELINKLVSDKVYYNHIKQRCIERSKKFDINNMVNSYLSIYHRVLGEHT